MQHQFAYVLGLCDIDGKLQAPRILAEELEPSASFFGIVSQQLFEANEVHTQYRFPASTWGFGKSLPRAAGGDSHQGGISFRILRSRAALPGRLPAGYPLCRCASCASCLPFVSPAACAYA